MLVVIAGSFSIFYFFFNFCLFSFLQLKENRNYNLNYIFGNLGLSRVLLKATGDVEGVYLSQWNALKICT